VVEEASRSVLAAQPNVPFRDFAKRVFGRLAGQLNVELDERGMNGRAIQTVHAFYRELTGAALPA